MKHALKREINKLEEELKIIRKTNKNKIYMSDVIKHLDLSSADGA